MPVIFTAGTLKFPVMFPPTARFPPMVPFPDILKLLAACTPVPFWM
jgi:hypothetical protein